MAIYMEAEKHNKCNVTCESHRLDVQMWTKSELLKDNCGFGDFSVGSCISFLPFVTIV